MAKIINELEFDEFEKLLCEIPGATSANPNSEEPGLTNFSKNLDRMSLDDSLSLERPMPICANPSKRILSEKLLNNGGLNEGKVSVGNIQQSTIKMVQQEEPNLPDDQSLTSALEELSFKDGVMMGSVSPPLVNYKSFQNRSLFVNVQCPNSLKELPSNVDSQLMAVPAPRAPNNSASVFDGFDMNAQELKKRQIGYCQPTENFSGAVPFAHGVQGFHLLTNMPVPGVEFPIISDQQKFYFDTQSPLPYPHPQHLRQPHITWRHMVEEQFYRMHQQYLHLQQLRNQQWEGHHPIQENANVETRLMGRSPRQPCNQGPLYNKATISRSINPYNLTLSSADFNTVQVLDQARKQNIPEKILTRSNGLNTLRSVKFGSFGGNEHLANVNQNGRVLPNGYFHRSLPIADVGFQLDSLSSRGSSPNIADVKQNNVRLPLQRYNSIDEFTSSIYLMAKDQHGCRLLQRKFTEGTQEDAKKIFLEIIEHIVELMTDPFGNYLVQKLLEVCDEDQHMQILQTITRKAGDLVRISCDMHGTRAVQKVVETIKTPEQFFIVVSSLKPGIVTLIKNMNGNHVAQRCLQYLTPEYCEFVFEAATINCIELSTDRHGCCVLQKCLSHSNGEQRRRLVCEITSNALTLSQDPFGNYVVQFVFEIHVPWATADILDQLEGNYGDLSMQKYSSNVVEKCLKYAVEERRACIIQELINNPRLDQIMQDPYGNYVIQAALNLSTGALHAALMEAIRTHVPVLRTSPYGKKVLSSNGLKK